LADKKKLDKNFKICCLSSEIIYGIISFRKYAFKELKSLGAHLSTAECLMFGFVKDSSDQYFERMKQIFLEKQPDTGLTNSNQESH
jgi:hypothetical protein